MGLLSGFSVGAGLSGAGYAAGQVGQDWGKAILDQDKVKLAAQLQASNEEATDYRRASIAEAAEKRQPELQGSIEKAKLGAQFSPEQIAAEADKAKRLQQATFDVQYDPQNQQKALAYKQLELQRQADFDKVLGGDQDYLDARRKLAIAQNPAAMAEASAAVARAAMDRFNLHQGQQLDAARKTLAAATAAKDTDAIASAQSNVRALEYTAATDVAQRSSLSSALTAVGQELNHERVTATNPMTANTPAGQAAAQRLPVLQQQFDSYSSQLSTMGSFGGAVKPPANPGAVPPGYKDPITGKAAPVTVAPSGGTSTAGGLLNPTSSVVGVGNSGPQPPLDPQARAARISYLQQQLAGNPSSPSGAFGSGLVQSLISNGPPLGAADRMSMQEELNNLVGQQVVSPTTGQ